MAQHSRAHVVNKSNAKADALRREIQYIDRVIESKTTQVRKFAAEGRERDALSVTDEIGRLQIDRDNKKCVLKRLEKAQGLHAKVSDFAEAQDIVKELTSETKRLATVLDIDDIGETNMEARVVDRELDEMLSRIGLNADDRQEEEQGNRELMLQLLQHQPIQQQQQQVANTTVATKNTSTSTNSTYRSQIDHMLL